MNRGGEGARRGGGREEGRWGREKEGGFWTVVNGTGTCVAWDACSRYTPPFFTTCVRSHVSEQQRKTAAGARKKKVAPRFSPWHVLHEVTGALDHQLGAERCPQSTVGFLSSR